MTEHPLGLRPKTNGQAGAPVVGVERTQIGSAADVRQRGIRETDTTAAAKQKTSGIPSFEDNPLGAIGLILQEVAAGIKGTPSPVAAANRNAIEQQSFQLRKDAQTLQAIKFGIEQFEAFPEGDHGALISTIEKMSPEAAAVLSEMSKAGAEKARALLDFVNEHPETFPGFATIARLVGVKKAVGIYGGIVADVTKQAALAPGKEDAAQKQADLDIATTLEKQKVLGPGIIDLEGKKEAARQKASGGKKSALLEGGAIKSSVTAELRKLAGIAHGGRVIDELTGEVAGLNREQSANVVTVIAEAERLIQSGKVTSAGDAIKQAVRKVGLPEVVDPEIQISTKMREQLLDQRVEVTVLRGFAEDLLGDVSLGTGALSNFKAAMDATVGQVIDAVFDGGVFFEDTQRAREDIRLFNQEVKRAIVNNPRFPVAEQEIVQKMLTDPNAWFKNPATAVINFRQLIDWIDRKESTTGSLLEGKIPNNVKGGNDDELNAEVNRILGVQ